TLRATPFLYPTRWGRGGSRSEPEWGSNTAGGPRSPPPCEVGQGVVVPSGRLLSPEAAAMTPASPWWAPHRHADRRPRLIARNAIAADIRAWLAARDFVEVDTAILQVSPGNEAHLSAF